MKLKLSIKKLRLEKGKLIIENEKFKNIIKNEKSLIKGESTFYQDKNNSELVYCSVCWDLNKKLVHISKDKDNDGSFYCPNPNCKNSGIYNKELNARYNNRQNDFFHQLNSNEPSEPFVNMSDIY